MGTWAVVCLLALMAVLNARADPPTKDEMTVTAEGMAVLDDDIAAAEDEAIWDAKRNAVEQVAGIFLRARSVGRDFSLEDDEIRTRSDGFIRTWERVPGSRRIENAPGGNGQILHIKIRASVALLPVVERLSDIQDVYNDLERPRLKVEIVGENEDSGPARAVRDALASAFQAQSFEMAESGPAEIVLEARLKLIPTVRMGDPNAPYGVGDLVAASRAQLTLSAVSVAGEEDLLTVQSEGSGRSFQSDAEAAVAAASDAAASLLQANEGLFVRKLLVRWVREREEGHPVVVQTTGLSLRERADLRTRLCAMRGFRNAASETGDKHRWTLHFITRLDTRGVRRRLASLRLDDGTTLRLLSRRGPLILCAACAPARTSRR